MNQDVSRSTALGYYYAIAAMVMWGTFPVYWKWLDTVGTLEILAHRTVWCAAFTCLVLAWQKRAQLEKLFVRPLREWYVLCASAISIAANWGLFIWAVQGDHVIEASMGYFLTPLISIVLGWMVFRESLRIVHWIAVSLAVLGVLIQIISLGVTPWLGLLIGFSFSAYGALRKYSSADSLTGLLIETLILTPVAIIYLIYLSGTDMGMQFLSGEPWLDALLLLGGVVTAIPLMLYVASARLLALSIVGFLFYINPTLQFLVGRFLYQEPFGQGQLLGFILIWTGLLVFTLSNLRQRHKQYRTC